MLRDLAPVSRLLAAWAATAKACVVRVAELIAWLFSAEATAPLLALPRSGKAPELLSAPGSAGELIRRVHCELANQLQPRAPPVAA